MMNGIRFTNPDTLLALFWMGRWRTASGSAAGGSIGYVPRQANIPATPPYNPEAPPAPDSPIKPYVPHIPDELPQETPPEIEEPPPDVIPVPVREPPRARQEARRA